MVEKKASASKTAGTTKKASGTKKAAGERSFHVAGSNPGLTGDTKQANMFWPGSMSGQMGNSDISQFIPVYAPGMGADDVLVPDEYFGLRSMYRYFYKWDEYVGQAIDIHTEIPMSRFILLPPKAETEEGQKITKRAMRIYEHMRENLNLFELMLKASHEYWLIGEYFLYHEYDEVNKIWSKIIVLDPDYMEVETASLGGDEVIYLVPEATLTQHITGGMASPGPRTMGHGQDFIEETERMKTLVEELPDRWLSEIEETGRIKLNTDPSKGSFVFHAKRSASIKEERGSSILNRVLRTLIYRDQLRSVQSMISQRNLSNIHLVYSETTDTGLDDDQFNLLKEQVDLALNTPDFTIVTDFPVVWQIIGGESRMIDLTSEYDQTTERLMVGLGLTPEILKGEGMYTSARISIEILNLRYQLYIQRLSEYIEKFIFKPIAIVNNFSEEVIEEGDGQTATFKKYLYPKVSFSRTTLYDSESVFEMLWNMYLKGSLSIRTIMDVVSLDYDIEKIGRAHV